MTVLGHLVGGVCVRNIVRVKIMNRTFFLKVPLFPLGLHCLVSAGGPQGFGGCPGSLRVDRGGQRSKNAIWAHVRVKIMNRTFFFESAPFF